jgi:predicted ATPase/DNA-binding XRE family transcriptional regulator
MHALTSFGSWVQLRRKALDLTQAELAERVNCAVGTIRKIESDERRPSKQIAARLAEELHLPPGQRERFLKAARATIATAHLEAPALSEAPALPAEEPARQRASLPAQLTPLIGREREIAEVAALLRRPEARLVTLSGPGGVGKTRLGLQIAAEVLDDFSDGCSFVNLAPLGDPGLVATTILHALGVAEAPHRSAEESLQAFLRPKRLLLLLDNFEQVLEAALLVARLLAAAPGLSVLATSRSLLRLYGEHEFVVPPLALPSDPDSSAAGGGNAARKAVAPPGPAAAELTAYAAVKLFIARAQAAKAGFSVTDDDARAIAAICARLDGLPLAIELAAARVKFFPPQALLARLQSPLQLLTGGPRDLPVRQQALRNTLDWSYNLLEAQEQVLFRRLGAFVGGFTLQAAAAICDDEGVLPPDSAEVVISLADKSLLRRGDGLLGEPRFTMPATVRAYALERLAVSGEVEAVRQRHAEHYLALAERVREEYRGAAEVALFSRLEHDLDNLRAALDWSHATKGGAAIELRLATALAQFWVVRGYAREGWERVQAALARRSQVSDAVRAQALTFVALFPAHLGAELEQLSPFLAEGLTLNEALGDTWGAAWVLMAMGFVAAHQGDHQRATQLNQQSLSLYQSLDEPWGMSISYFQLGELALLGGALERASAFLEQSLALCRQSIGTTWALARRMTCLGMVVLMQGDDSRARALFAESLTMCYDSQDRVDIPMALVGLAEVARSQGRPGQAARLLGAAGALSEASGSYRGLTGGLLIERATAALHAQLDDATFSASWAEGQVMTLEQAKAAALGESR